MCPPETTERGLTVQAATAPMTSAATRGVMPGALWAALNALAVAVAPAALLADSMFGPRHAMLTLAVGGFVFGGWFFWWHGGRQITAAGMLAYALMALCAFPCLYFVSNGLEITPPLLVAATAAYATTVVALLMQRPTAVTFPQVRVAQQPPQRGTVAPLLVFGGVLVLAAGAAAVAERSPGANVFIEGAGWLGALLLVLAFLRPRRRRKQRLTVTRVVLGLAAYSTYIVLVFDGFGRLELVSLGFAVAIIAGCLALPGRLAKGVLLGLLLPGLIVLGASRAGGGTRLVFDESNDGLGSVVSPMQTFGRLVSEAPEYAYGHTFLSTAVIYVPRSIWPDKPVGFGRELAYKYASRWALLNTPVSYAALWQGEWYWNFGWVGVALSAVALGWFVRFLDRHLAKALRGNRGNVRQVLWAVLWTTLAVSVPDLYWTGTFAFAQRALGRVTLAAALLVAVAAHQRIKGSPGRR